MRELEIVALGAADGLVGPRPAEAGEGPKHADVHNECLNCSAPLHGQYCYACGQPADDHHRSIFHLIWEAIEGLTHLDGRLARTLPPLFLNPGKLARDHFEGRRQRHVPPFRLFLITLLIFMFSLELLTHHGSHPAKSAGGATTTHAEPAATTASKPAAAVQPSDPAKSVAASRSAAGTTVKLGGGIVTLASGDRAHQPTDAETDLGFQQMSESKFGKTLAGRWVAEHGRKSLKSKEYFQSLMFEWGHRLAILMLPIFAGMLALVYFYKRQFYIYDHLVVAMHFLSFTFLIWAVVYLIPDPVGDWCILAATIWTPVNLFMTLRGAYGSSIAGAVVKTFFLWTVALSLFLTLLLGVIFIAMGSM